ncbi:MAG TPA: hypothetical protein VGL62_02170 [Vicinamibacterales bacterium]|jgi:hypothetical protein
MGTFLVLFGLAAGLAALVIGGVFVMAALTLKLAVRLILLPLLLIKWLVGGVVLLIVGPILLVVGVAVCAVLAVVFALPLLPLIVAAGLIWLLVRASRRPALI